MHDFLFNKLTFLACVRLTFCVTIKCHMSKTSKLAFLMLKENTFSYDYIFHILQSVQPTCIAPFF